MPMPEPRQGEEKQDFISRFMKSKPMQAEYPDNKQRVAVAYSQWRRLFHKTGYPGRLVTKDGA